MKNIKYFTLFLLVLGLFFTIVGLTKAQEPCGGQGQPACSSGGQGQYQQPQMQSTSFDSSRLNSCIANKLGVPVEQVINGPIEPARRDPAQSTCLQELGMQMGSGSMMGGGQMMGPNQMMGPQGGQMMGPQGGQMMGPQGGQMMGPQGGQMMGGGMEGQQFGPPPEVSQQQLKRMQREASGLEKILQTVQKQIAKVQSKGVTPSQECTDAVKELSDIVSSIKSATIDNWMEVGPQMMSMGQIMPQIETCIRSWSMVDQAKKAFTQTEKFIGNIDKQLTKIESKAIKSGLESLVNEIKTAISELKSSFNAIKEQFKTDTSVIEDLQDIFESGRDVQQKIANLNQAVQFLKKAPSFLKTAISKEKAYDKRIASLDKKGEDTEEAKDLLTQLKEARMEIEVAINEKDWEIAGEGIANYFDIVGQLDQILGVKAQITPIPFAMPGVEVPAFQVPKSFNMFMQGGPSMGGGGVNPVGESNPQPSPGPNQMMQQQMMPGIQNFLEKLTPQQKDSIKANILNSFKIR